MSITVDTVGGKLGVGVSKDTGLSDLLMLILVKEVRAVDTISDWIIERLVNKEGF